MLKDVAVHHVGGQRIGVVVEGEAQFNLFAWVGQDHILETSFLGRWRGAVARQDAKLHIMDVHGVQHFGLVFKHPGFGRAQWNREINPATAIPSPISGPALRRSCPLTVCLALMMNYVTS